MLGINSIIQWNLYVCMYAGFAMYIFNRKSFSFIIPNVVQQENVDKGKIGEVLSSMALAYSIGKFASGMLIDRFSPKLMFACGLFLCGLSNILFSISEPQYFSLIWFLNGLVQGPGWPSCAKILRRWYSPKVFGSLWSILSTSMNVPASIGPIAVTHFLDWNGGNWRSVMSISGVTACTFAFISFAILKDKPEDVGLTLTQISGEEIEYLSTKGKISSKSSGSTWSRILASPYTYIVSLGFLVALFMKGVISDWSSLYIIQEKNGNQHLSSTFIATVEFGGVIGSILSGIVSDRLVASLGPTPHGNRRHIWVIFSHLLLAASIFSLRNFVDDVSKQSTITSATGFAMGFSVYGIISLMGVLAIESSASDISGTSHALCSLVGNIGLMTAGLPFSMILKNFGWDISMQVCEILVCFVTVIFILSQCLKCSIGGLMKQE